MMLKYLFVALEVRHGLLSNTMMVTDACHWYTSLHLVSDFHFMLNRPGNMVLWRNNKENYRVQQKEASKFKTKEGTANIFLFLESTQNAVLHQRVLNKSSKWQP